MWTRDESSIIHGAFYGVQVRVIYPIQRAHSSQSIRAIPRNHLCMLHHQRLRPSYVSNDIQSPHSHHDIRYVEPLRLSVPCTSAPLYQLT